MRSLVRRLVLQRAFGFEYFVGVDGLSVLLVLLAPLVGLVAIAATRRLATDGRLRSTLAALSRESPRR